MSSNGVVMAPISCQVVKRQSVAYIDERLSAEIRQRLSDHLAQCESCALYFEQTSHVRKTLRALPAAAIPPNLKVSLRVIASRECANVVAHRGSRWRGIWENWKFRLNDLMRPVAIPATGGLLSSIILFGTLILTIGTATRTVSYEVPLNDPTQVITNLVPIELNAHAITLSMSLDNNGRITDYSFSRPDDGLPTDIQAKTSNISMPSMPTVFAVAQPISGDIQIHFLPLGLRQ